MQRLTKNKRPLILLVLALAVGIYFLPPVRSRVETRVELLRARIVYFFNPPSEAVFQPGEQNPLTIETALATARAEFALTLTPQATSTPKAGPTPTPTITSTPTITFTPAITDTPPFTTTPFIPLAIEALFESVITPNPNAAFSQLQFTRNCSNFLEFEAAAVFQNPTRYICGVFTYAEMLPGSQWTALWYRDGELVHYETIPWDGETGGYGFTEWEAPPEEWLPGNYEVQIFVGLEWKVVGQFILQGDAPTRVPTLSPTISPSPAVTQTPAPPLSTGTAVTGTP